MNQTLLIKNLSLVGLLSFAITAVLYLNSMIMFYFSFVIILSLSPLISLTSWANIVISKENKQ